MSDITDLDDLYRNDPTATFEGHLFEADAVEDAGGGPGEQTDRPVASLCSRTTAYGEFHHVAPHEGDERILGLPGVDKTETVAEAYDLCDVCAERLDGLYAEWRVENADYADLQAIAADTSGVPGSGISEADMREQLLDQYGTASLADELRKVRA